VEYSDKLNADMESLNSLKESNEKDLKKLNETKIAQTKLLNDFNEQKEMQALIIENNEKNLIAHSISVINSSSSASNDIKNALMTLKSLVSELNSNVAKAQANEAINIGNQKIILLNSSSNNSSINNTFGNFDINFAKATYSMVSTAYSGHSITAMGIKPTRDPNGLSTIAVDPSVLPLGSKVYIPGYGYAICSDTGGAIKGNKIDVFFNSNSECYSWGVQTVTLYVVGYAGEW
jgi:3D (Asp-Asp-Asp) domain-containing protein